MNPVILWLIFGLGGKICRSAVCWRLNLSDFTYAPLLWARPRSLWLWPRLLACLIPGAAPCDPIQALALRVDPISNFIPRISKIWLRQLRKKHRGSLGAVLTLALDIGEKHGHLSSP